MSSENFDVLVIGAGAAGLFCAAQAGQLGARVCLLEQNAKVGRKIFISGGGRCNFTNKNPQPENFYCENKHFVKSALNRYTADDFIDLVKSYGIGFHEKKLGQLFCDERSQGIINMLLEECKKGNVDLRLNHKVKKVQALDDAFAVDGIVARKLVVATGGLSIPKFGADGFGYKLGGQFGHTLVKTDPALVGMEAKGNWLSICQSISGVSLDCEVKIDKQTYRENVLFTHRGLSGPAMLQASLYWDPEKTMRVNFLPNKDLAEELSVAQKSQPKSQLNTVLKSIFPDRFVEEFIPHKLEMDLTQQIAQLSKKQLNLLVERTQRFEFTPKDWEGYKKAEVTRGGINVKDVSSKTFESKLKPGLYFIGEVLDVAGWLGGYNFQWAWSSGFVAAHAVNESLAQ